MRKLEMGSDPEFGLLSPCGKLAPACIVLPPKEESIVVSSGFDAAHAASFRDASTVKINRDAFNGEFQAGPASCMTLLLDAERAALVEAEKLASKAGLRLFIGDHCECDEDMFGYATPDSMVSGCNTSYYAGDGQPGEVLPEYERVLRNIGSFFGAHIHLSCPPLTDDQKAEFIRFNTIVSVVPMALAVWNEGQVKRYRTMGVGIFRKPKYGVEVKDFGGSTLRSFMHRAAAFGYSRTAINVYMGYAGWDSYSASKVFVDRDIATYKAITSAVTFRDAEAALKADTKDGLQQIYDTIKPHMLLACKNSPDDCSPWYISPYSGGDNAVDGWEKVMKNPDLAGANIRAGWKMDENHCCHTMGLLSGIRRMGQ